MDFCCPLLHISPCWDIPNCLDPSESVTAPFIWTVHWLYVSQSLVHPLSHPHLVNTTQTSTSLVKPPGLGIFSTTYLNDTRPPSIWKSSLSRNWSALWPWESFPTTPSLGFLICQTGIMTHNSASLTTTNERMCEPSTVLGTQKHLANGSSPPSHESTYPSFPQGSLQ